MPALFHQWGLNEIWAEAYGEVEGVTWLGAGAWDPCHFNTVNPIRSLEDFKGLRVSTFPTAGRFLSRFGVVPVTLPIEGHRGRGADRGARRHRVVRNHRGLHGGLGRRHQLLPHQQHLRRLVRVVLRELREVGGPPAHLQELFRLCMDSSHYYRQHWYWGGEAHLRVNGAKLELTSIPDEEWAEVEAEAVKFWGRDSRPKPRATAKVVSILRAYNETMSKARAGPTGTPDTRERAAHAGQTPQRSGGGRR